MTMVGSVNFGDSNDKKMWYFRIPKLSIPHLIISGGFGFVVDVLEVEGFGSNLNGHLGILGVNKVITLMVKDNKYDITL